MAQITNGIRSILSNPGVYDFTQTLFGAGHSRRLLVSEHIQPRSGDIILDIGCGTGEIVPYLPDGVHYFGFDLSEPYIRAARQRHGERARFECMDVVDFHEHGVDQADLVIAIGLLHHLDDAQAEGLIRTAWTKLKAGGRLVTLDGTLTTGQSALARFMILRDRGQNIRSPEAYEAIAARCFSKIHRTVRGDLLHIPYTHCVLECTRV